MLVKRDHESCSDVLFLKLALARGMTIAAVAGFLGREEDEVREKVEELRRKH
jgi:predicted CopG family antitoxin